MPFTSILETATTLETQEVADRTFITRFRSPGIAPLVTPGQFVMVSLPETSDPLLPRAFSVCDVTADELSLLYVAVGRVTKKISVLEPGESLVMNGPLGVGFPEMSEEEKVWTVVGGSGAALVPILNRAAKRTRSRITFFYGAKTESQLVNFKEISSIRFATDDGSTGFCGNAVQMFKNELADAEPPDMLFGCGPTPMLISMQKEVGSGIPTYLSVETPMACGMGFCQGCPVRKAGGNDYYLACKDGPVFRSTDIEFEVKP